MATVKGNFAKVMAPLQSYMSGVHNVIVEVYRDGRMGKTLIHFECRVCRASFETPLNDADLNKGGMYKVTVARDHFMANECICHSAKNATKPLPVRHIKIGVRSRGVSAPKIQSAPLIISVITHGMKGMWRSNDPEPVDEASVSVSLFEEKGMPATKYHGLTDKKGKCEIWLPDFKVGFADVAIRVIKEGYHKYVGVQKLTKRKKSPNTLTVVI